MNPASPSTFTYSDIATMIDHALLSPTLTSADLEAGCRLAVLRAACVGGYAPGFV